MQHAPDAPRNWVCTALKAQLDNIVLQANQQKVSPTNAWVGLWTVRNADLSKATYAPSFLPPPILSAPSARLGI